MVAVTVKTAGLTQIDLALSRRIAALTDMRPELEAAAGIVYEATRQRFDSNGDGMWPPLAESTVARKASQGVGEPERPLYAEGNLFESATSPSGPYSVQTAPTDHQIVLGIDWEEDGYQIPQVLSQGAGDGGGFPTGGHSAKWHIPARPIWPSPAEVLLEVAEILMAGIKQ